MFSFFLGGGDLVICKVYYILTKVTKQWFVILCLFLPGQARVGVIVHDFPKDKLDTDEKKKVEMEAFKHKQLATFQHSSLQIMAGKLDGPVEFEETQWKQLQKFLAASNMAPKPRVRLTFRGALSWIWGELSSRLSSMLGRF